MHPMKKETYSADKKSAGWMRDRHPAGTSEGTVTA